jgi:hypothetical protein
MATNEWDQDDDFDLEDDAQQSYDGGDLVKKLRKAKRADEKRIKELTEQLESLSKAQRERVVRDVLSQKGVNEKAARLILKDLDDVNEESVSHWLEDNGDLLGLQPKPQVTQEQQIDRAALRQQDIVTQGAITPDKAEEQLMRIQNATTAEEIIDMIQSGEL